MTAKAVRRRLNPVERRGLILDEALRLFAERHYSAVTVRDIALTCEINVGLIYHYFDSKDDLVRCALGHAIEQLIEGYEQRRVASDDPRDEILAWLDMHIAIAPTLSRMVKLMSDCASSDIRDAEIDALVAGFYQSEKSVLESALQKGVASGRFAPLDVPKMARRIGLMLDGIFHASASRGDNRIIADIRDLADFLDTVLVVGSGSRE
jgi:AcrR family transcriptional regulator